LLLLLRAVILQVGGSGVLVQPMTYIFDEEPARWSALLETLGVSPDSIKIA
jgi:ATP phosphoribosyltransferase